VVKEDGGEGLEDLLVEGAVGKFLGKAYGAKLAVEGGGPEREFYPQERGAGVMGEAEEAAEGREDYAVQFSIIDTDHCGGVEGFCQYHAFDGDGEEARGGKLEATWEAEEACHASKVEVVAATIFGREGVDGV